MIQFYTPDIEETLTLPETESGHCCRVLRLKEGDEIESVDGRGHRFRSEITLAHPKHTKVRILQRTDVEPARRHKVTLAVAPTKNIDRIEWLLEKAVEVGVDRIVLVKCEHSERKNVNCERLEKIIVSAMKQSLKASLPQFDGFVQLKEFLKGEAEAVSAGDGKQRFVGYCSDEVERRSLAGEYAPGRDAILLIGPEGDFSPEEIDMALKSGFTAATFGEMRLRTETAALYGLQSVHIANDIAHAHAEK